MKTFLRGLSFVAAAFLLAPLVVYGQGIPGGISGIVVTAPQLIFISGQQMQLEAVARDGQGNPRTADKFTFRSSNPAVVSVDAAGIATAGSPGVAGISAVVQGTNAASSAIQLQVIPFRIDITGGNSILQVGDSA